jgi:hypothetical protein
MARFQLCFSSLSGYISRGSSFYMGLNFAPISQIALNLKDKFIASWLFVNLLASMICIILREILCI